MDFRGQVWKRVWKIVCFGLKLGQDLENRAAYPYRKFREVSPTPPPPPTTPGSITSHCAGNAQGAGELKPNFSTEVVSVVVLFQGWILQKISAYCGATDHPKESLQQNNLSLPMLPLLFSASKVVYSRISFAAVVWARHVAWRAQTTAAKETTTVQARVLLLEAIFTSVLRICKFIKSGKMLSCCASLYEFWFLWQQVRS